MEVPSNQEERTHESRYTGRVGGDMNSILAGFVTY